MALLAGHIRFALDVKDKYGVTELHKYISGAVYPDSRYVTGTERSLTHPDNIDLTFFSKDDFRKGWLTHVICDELQLQIITKMFPEEILEHGYGGQGSDFWINLTAIKIIQDLDDLTKFEIKKYIDYLDYVESPGPNGEDVTVITKYNEIFTNMYHEPERVDVNSAIDMWIALGLSKDLAEKVRWKTEQYAKNPSIVQRAHGVYDQIILKFNN